MLRGWGRKVWAFWGISRVETRGLLVMMPCAIIALAVPFGIRWYDTKHASCSNSKQLTQALQALRLQQSARRNSRAPCRSSNTRLVLDINTAKQQDLLRIQGVTRTLAKRIVKFRGVLGGFVKKQQYQEIYGLSQKVRQHLAKHTRIDPAFVPVLLSVNSASPAQLSAHPYLDRRQALSIVRYRLQNGPFCNQEALRAVWLIDDHTLHRISPYLCWKSNSDK